MASERPSLTNPTLSGSPVAGFGSPNKSDVVSGAGASVSAMSDSSASGSPLSGASSAGSGSVSAPLGPSACCSFAAGASVPAAGLDVSGSSSLPHAAANKLINAKTASSLFHILLLMGCIPPLRRLAVHIAVLKIDGQLRLGQETGAAGWPRHRPYRPPVKLNTRRALVSATASAWSSGKWRSDSANSLRLFGQLLSECG